MQNPIGGAWPMAFFPPHLPGMPLTLAHLSSAKPRVGLGVICRCIPQTYIVECLLLKRGPKFVSPLKWSFPGGRLDEDNDADDDGERCTLRELKKECGGGVPNGLPPLIHIESYKAGRTLYHVFVIDCDAQPAWLNWQPSVTPQHTGEIEQSAGDLLLQGKRYKPINGFCWIDLQTLIEECIAVSGLDQDKMNSSVLQHGLIRWVKSNGENILKMLMARSPKLERHRRYPSSGNSNTITQNKGSQGRPRSGSAGSRMHKHPQDSHLFSTPMMPPHQVFRPPDHYSNPGVAPLIQMTMPLTGTIPDFLKHSTTGDMNSYIPQTTGGDHTHIFHPPLVHMQSGPSDSSSSQSSQHSPVKNVGNDEKQVGNNFVPFDGNNIDGNNIQQQHQQQQQQHQQQYGGGLLPMQLAPEYDLLQFQQAAMLQGHGGQINIDMMNNTSDHSRYQQHNHNRRSDVCRNFLNGHCLYGEKCWFVHSDHKPHREPLLGPGGILNTAMPQGGVFPGMGMLQYMSQYPSNKPPMGGSQVNPASPNPAWQLHGVGNRPSVPFVQRGFVGGGAQPQVLLRPFMFQNRFAASQTDHTIIGTTIPDPVLRFRLLSEGSVRNSTGSLIADITSLSVRADHFFVTFQKYLCDYQVLFGSDKPHDNHLLTNEQMFNNNITCIHISKINSSLLIIGTASEGVYTYDMKRNGSAIAVNPITVVHESQHSDASITALVHFTTVAAAQVVVTGNSKGEITWHIAQPPMKTFSVLTHQKAHVPNPVICLQILGGCLVSGSSNGMVCLWNMRTPEPILADNFQAHSESFLNIHVLDTSCFITVGVNQEPSILPSQMVANDNRPDVARKLSHETPPTEMGKESNVNPTEKNLENISAGLANISINNSSSGYPNYCISLWEYGKPIKNFKTLDNIGPVTCSAFYQHPLLGNCFLALGLMGGAVKIYNLPSFTIASEIHFQDIADRNCCHIALNLSRDKEHTYNFKIKNPFRDLILTTVWSDGRIMVCQIDPRKNG